MIVVSDSSPLITLAKIGLFDLLPKLYGKVFIPGKVAEEIELGGADAPPIRCEDFREWLIVQTPASRFDHPDLDEGEAASIALVQEIGANFLLIDEKLGRKIAGELGILVIGTIGVLEFAAKSQLVDLELAFEQIKQTDFRISHAFLDSRLAAHREQISPQ